MLEDEVLLLPALMRRFAIRSDRTRRPRDARELELAREVLFLLRSGLEFGDPDVRSVLGTLSRALSLPGSDRVNAFDASPLPQASERLLLQQLEHELVEGRLRVEELALPQIRDVERIEAELPPLPPAPRERAETLFEVTFVDEVGRGINGARVEIAADGRRAELSTNAAGTALLEPAQGSSASVEVLELEALDAVLDERWVKPRPGSAPTENKRADRVFRGGAPGAIAIKAALPNLAVLRPPLGRIFVELYDKWGKVRHTECDFTIDGPASFSGKTDELGRILIDDVFPGNYTLKLTVVIFEGDAQRTDVYETPLVVLDTGSSEPEIRMLGAVPSVVLARLHAFFNTNKAFLLPTAIAGLRSLRELYFQNNPGELLVVGHADTAGGSKFNDELSLERAESMIAYLDDDVDAWLAFYDAGKPAKKRWGKVEDGLMLRALPDFRKRPKTEEPVRWFQRTRSLEVDGKAGPETRRQLVTEYMALDGVTLADAEIQIPTTAHGAGENFPLDDRGAELDDAAEDGKRDFRDRRVELFFFDPEFGIVPPPPGDNSGAGSAQYPEWRKRAVDVRDFETVELDGPKLHFVELADAHFRLDSAVVLPEGEAPSDDEHEAFTSAGTFGSVLAFAQGHPDKRLVVAGHTDTSGSEKDNQTLSEERAQVALCCVEGTSVEGRRDEFSTLCDGRHKVSDIKQILSWAARKFGFECDPGKVDEVKATATEPIKGFQSGYNAAREALGVPDAEELEVDGDFGPKTWGAVFDCYEAALAEEVSRKESAAERLEDLAELRKSLRFVDVEKKSAGFGELYPIDELGVDDFRSQENRRVELLFFDLEEQPDLDVPPEDSDIYQPGVFVRNPIPVAKSPLEELDKLSQVAHRLRSNSGCVPLASLAYKLDVKGRILTGTTDADGFMTHDLLPAGDHELEISGKKTKLATLPRGAAPVLHRVREFFLGPA
jgi:outer membrane protein OmpA-like peptidoglycan-associated protein